MTNWLRKKRNRPKNKRDEKKINCSSVSFSSLHNRTPPWPWKGGLARSRNCETFPQLSRNVVRTLRVCFMTNSGHGSESGCAHTSVVQGHTCWLFVANRAPHYAHRKWAARPSARSLPLMHSRMNSSGMEGHHSKMSGPVRPPPQK